MTLVLMMNYYHLPSEVVFAPTCPAVLQLKVQGVGDGDDDDNDDDDDDPPGQPCSI